MPRTKNIVRPGLLLRRGKKNLILGVIGPNGTVDHELEEELERMLGELGWPGMQKTIKRHKNGVIVYGGSTFTLLHKRERLEALLERQGIKIKPQELFVVFGAT